MGTRYKRPATPEARAARDKANAEKLEDLQRQMAEQVESLRSGEDWQRWLKVAAKFHNYSFGNVLLILKQNGNATHVAGYQAWKTFNRQVNKGERGIQILAPVMSKRAKEELQEDEKLPNNDEDQKQEQQTHQVPVGWRISYVWDISQTSGEPLPEPPDPQLLTGDAPEGLWDKLAELVEVNGFRLERGECPYQANGITDWREHVVRVRADVDDAQAVKTLAHELAHVMLHDPAQSGQESTLRCRGTVEVEAESVAYLVASHAGMATGSYTFPYVAGWAESTDNPTEVIKETGRRVMTTARVIISALEAVDALAQEQIAQLAQSVEQGKQRTATLREESSQRQINEQAHQPAKSLDERLYAANAAAEVWFQQQLAAHTGLAAREYLDSRQVDSVTSQRYGVGYAPHKWTGLVDALREQGFEDQEILDAGLGWRGRRGNLLDVFRDRLMFPIKTGDGLIVGFSGRALGTDHGTPKYRNTASTQLFHKGEHLIGVDQLTLSRVAQPQALVLTEGPFDAMAVTQATGGTHLGLAMAGTAITKEHLEKLRNALENLNQQGECVLVLAFDNDQAGVKATKSVWSLLEPEQAVRVAVLSMPNGQDPAEFASHAGQAALRKALHESTQSLTDTVVDQAINSWLTDAHGRKIDTAEAHYHAFVAASKFVAQCPAQEIPRQIVRIAQALDVDTEQAVKRVLDEISDAGVSQDQYDQSAHTQERLLNRNRRNDLDRGQGQALPQTTPHMAMVMNPAKIDLSLAEYARSAETEHRGVKQSQAVSG